MERFLAQYMPPDASAHGAKLDMLNALVHWLMLFLFVVWGVYFIYVLYRFNRKRSPAASYDGVQSHFSSYAEAGVAIVEVILLVGFSIPAWYRWSSRPGPETNPLEVRVVAEQFAWNIQYPGPDGKFGRVDPKLMSASNPLGLDTSDKAAQDDIVTLNDLHFQVNRPVIIRLTSKDVIHSFNLPVMRVKQDAIPGTEIPVHFVPVKTNFGPMKWEIACAQLCGLGHYRMRGMFTVQTKGDFDAWMKENAPAVETPAAPSPEARTVAVNTPG
jgi:cytochrome c oxidase subunit 2